mgnify:CR=1 FL=1
MTVSRRHLLQGALAAAAASPFTTWSRSARAQAADAKLLFIVSANGGASITDAFLPLTTDEAADGVRAYAPDDVVDVGGFRVVRPLDNQLQGSLPIGTGYSLVDFVNAHGDDLVVMTQENTSVNHDVAAHRSLTGSNVFNGRTLGEAVASVHGRDLVLPNVVSAYGGYARPGTDPSLAATSRGEPVANPLLFALGTHGSQGVRGATVDARVVERARRLRRRLEERSPFVRTFKQRGRLRDYLSRRDDVAARLEADNLIQKLMMVPDPDHELPYIGLQATEESVLLDEVFPERLDDPMHAQASLAFLLARYGVSCAVTLSTANAFFGDTGLKEPPLAFDYSHTEHVAAQNSMWGRTMETVDKLIQLLKRTPHLGNPDLGSMWSRSLIYVATEFGRDRDANAGGSSHHLNNGSVLLSPMLQGGRVYGGVDVETGLTYGFDRDTGEARPGTVMPEGDVYSVIADAFDVDFDARSSLPCLHR